MNHFKRYTDKGVDFLCGEKVIISNKETHLCNWQLNPCECGIEVWTIGHSPETDEIIECGHLV